MPKPVRNFPPSPSSRAALPSAPGSGQAREPPSHHRGPVCHRQLAAPAATGCRAGGHRGICRGGGGEPRGSRSRSRDGVARGPAPATPSAAAPIPVRRGEVFWADLSPRSGSEQRGRRPVVVVSNDGFNVTPAWQSVIVVPISTSKGPGATRADRRAAPGRLGEPPAIERRPVPPGNHPLLAKLTERVGMLPAALLAQIHEALRAALDLHRPRLTTRGGRLPSGDLLLPMRRALSATGIPP